MAIEGATERAVFFDTDDFATASSYTPSGGSASTVNGIFDNEFLEVGPLSGVGVVSAQPRFICTTADLPDGAAAGDAIETALADREYLCAGRFTIADIAVGFSVHFALFSVGLNEVLRPNTARWWDQLTERDAYRKLTKNLCL